MAVSTDRGERLAAIGRESQTERPHLATKADIADLKAWLTRRILIGAAIVQGTVAALFEYLPSG